MVGWAGARDTDSGWSLSSAFFIEKIAFFAFFLSKFLWKNREIRFSRSDLVCQNRAVLRLAEFFLGVAGQILAQLKKGL
jgi:hypothetical protein